MNHKGVVVGSKGVDFCDLWGNPQTAYFLGLWCADGYHRTSSIGLSNIDESLIFAFQSFLAGLFPKDRLCLRVYIPKSWNNANYAKKLAKKAGIKRLSICSILKARMPTIHIYVNSRPLLRLFREERENLLEKKRNSESVWAYFAGRFDGDGSVSKDMRSDCRIVYGNQEEALRDKELLKIVKIAKTKIYYYKNAKTYCLYISRFEAEKFLENIRAHARSQKSTSLPSRDLVR